MHFENYLGIPEEFVIYLMGWGHERKHRCGMKAFIPLGGNVCGAVCVRVV